MSEPELVEAEVLEEGLAALSGSEEWLARARERVAAIVARYHVPERLESDRDYKDAKANLAEVRRDMRDLDGERKRMTREMDDALKRFRAAVGDVLEPLRAVEDAYAAPIGDYEERWVAERRSALAEEYQDYAPALMDLVPLERLITLLGSEKGKGWLQRQTNVEAAKAAMRAAIDQVAHDEDALAQTVAAEDLGAAKAVLFTTLDLGAALREAQERAAQRERVRRLEEERRAREQEQARVEALMAAEPAPDPMGPAPAPAGLTIPEQLAVGRGRPMPGEPVPDYVFCGYGTQAQAEAFVAWCREHGVERRAMLPTHGRQFKLTTR